MYYLVYVTDDADCKAVYGPAVSKEYAVEKLIDYIEVGLVSGRKRNLTLAEKVHVATHHAFVVEPNGSAWYIIEGKAML